jgi:CubicO group peptidase (beta-lactamase class C family)
LSISGKHVLKTLAATLAVVGLAMAVPGARQNAFVTTPPFESYLESLRQQAGIPGLSAAIVHEGHVLWERGFGFQNVEARIPATPDTPYPIADVSQTLAAVLLLQCVEQRHLDLDQPVRQHGVVLPEAGATMRHVMMHTSNGIPGETFRYDPERYAQLTLLVEACAPQPYRKSVAHRILERLAMIDSVPGRDLQDPSVVAEGLYDTAALDRYARVLQRIAVPYKSDRRGRMVRAEMPPVDGINAATGLVSTVRDLAKFNAALDDAILLREETLQAAWTNARAADQTTLPAGLGWFVQNYRGHRLVWHFGNVPGAYSSLILKVPERKLTLILLANSDGLSATFQLHAGDVTRSVFALVFLRLLL